MPLLFSCHTPVSHQHLYTYYKLNRDSALSTSLKMKLACKASLEVVEAWDRGQRRRKIMEVCLPCPPATSTSVPQFSNGFLLFLSTHHSRGSHLVAREYYIGWFFPSSRPWNQYPMLESTAQAFSPVENYFSQGKTTYK